jgi:hypothetical protein
MSSVVYILSILLIIAAYALLWLFLCFTKTGKSAIVAVLFLLLALSSLISLFVFTFRYPDWVIALTLGVVYANIVQEGGRALNKLYGKIQEDTNADMIRGADLPIANNSSDSCDEKSQMNI